MKKVCLWILSIFMMLAAMAAVSMSLMAVPVFLILALICNPIFVDKMTQINKYPKKIIVIPVFLILLAIGNALIPTDSSDGGSKDKQDIVADKSSATVSSTASAKVDETKAPTKESTKTPTKTPTKAPTKTPAAGKGEADTNIDTSAGKLAKLTVTFIDVGQGDCTLIQCDGKSMLIDAGNNDKGTYVQNYLKKQGIEKLDYCIGTHPDADHIGGMDVILYKFACNKVIMPDEEKDTNTYRDVIDTIDEKNLKITYPVVGKSYKLGDAAFTIIGPSKNYDDSNNNSVSIILTHGDKRFLFTGDAETEAENDMLKCGVNISNIDVYKTGHHGSSTALSEAFIDEINPKNSVISCGEDNSYGHPHAKTLNVFRAMGVNVYRTDEQGTIECTSDGSNIKWNCSPSTTWKAGEQTGSSAENIATKAPQVSKPSTDNGSSSGTKYVLNTNTHKIHLPGCSSVGRMSEHNKKFTNESIEELEAQGYERCQRCLG